MSISIIIVNFNGRDLLEPCLTATIEQADHEDAEVVLVDNASTDDSADYVRKRFPRVVVVQNAVNEGFAGGCNAGVRAARGDRIVLLNNDAIPDPGWLSELLAALEPEDVAIACSVIHDPRFPEAYALGTGSLSVIGHPIANVARELEYPFYATGCSLAFKRALFGEPFDPIYFAYYEDALLSWRAHIQGHRVTRALGSTVQHLGSVTARQMPGVATYYYERNKLLTLLLCYEWGTIARLWPLYTFDGIARMSEDLWQIVKHPRAARASLAAAERRYSLVLRGIGWLLRHRAEVAARRLAIQKERLVPDSTITPMMSGKIFDDVTPTRAHTIANPVALWYCRLAGISTAESARGRLEATSSPRVAEA